MNDQLGWKILLYISTPTFNKGLPDLCDVQMSEMDSEQRTFSSKALI